jgi:mRNA-degrading endonuclease RelE of RelBE toxin-antitoxin system
MEIKLSERVITTLHTLGTEDRERVSTWLDYLRNWDSDPFVKSQSLELNVRGQAVFMFRTSTDLRIFYTVDSKTKSVSVIDLATKDTILTSGGALVGRT